MSENNKIRARFLNGDEFTFGNDVTLGKIKVEFTKAENRFFAPEVTVSCSEAGRVLDDDWAADVPSTVIGILKEKPYNFEMWRETMRLHGCAGDVEGLRRAVRRVDEDPQIGYRGTEVLSKILMEKLESLDRLDPGSPRTRSQRTPPRHPSPPHLHRSYFVYRTSARDHPFDVKVFLDAGADVEYENFVRNTFLFPASCYCTAQEIGYLIDARADVNHVNHRGLTPLFEAARAGNLVAVNRLLEAKADVNYKVTTRAKSDRSGGYFGYTALSVATMKEHLPICDRLLEEGAE